MPSLTSLTCAYLFCVDVVYFKYDEHSVREDDVKGVTIELLLAEKARSDRVIKVYSRRSDDTASKGKLL